jgi:diguanylate cyclase (GGDEF)-like protein
MAADPASAAVNALRAADPASPEQVRDEQIRRLGELLASSIDDVHARTIARSKESDRTFDADTLERFQEISNASTRAVAAWMEGGRPEEGRSTGQQAFQTYGQLAAQRVAPLNELTKRCLRWRDSVRDVLLENAQRLEISQGALLHALGMVQRTIDVTLVRMGECFEIERQGTDEELARRQQELAFMATHDTLTGLPNRTLILDRAEQALARARRNQSPVAALFIDIDNFKTINDTFGHEAGDEVLRTLAARLDGVVRATDALGRLGGDEFVVIAEELSLEAGPEMIADRVVEALTEPVKLSSTGGTRLTITASIGIAVGTRACAEDLLRDADIAMYRAKWEGKNRYTVFESGMHDAIQSRMALEIDLRGALADEQFYLVYQPTFDLRAMRHTGFEALIRWKHPERGTVQPNDFIPLLEETGMILDVGRWVLEEACRQGALWRAAGHQIGIAVNVSGRQLDTDEFVAHVQHALAESGLEPSALTLEITETTLMRNIEATAQRLATLKGLGVRVAVDDFGTGYSSLAHLQRFPVDALKIDRSFISRLTQNSEGETLIHTLVQLGKALSIETLAEGIEQQEELSMLQAEQCDSGQGFLFAVPLEVSDADAFLQDGKVAPKLAPASAARAAG